ncbi:hypothetical protein A2U01_0107160, partial [Trifolium medium]|nr:hypothetical protein [Trifolium medium]
LILDAQHRLRFPNNGFRLTAPSAPPIHSGHIPSTAKQLHSRLIPDLPE